MTTSTRRPGGYDSRVAEAGRNSPAASASASRLRARWSAIPAILILDEATSALDPVLEKAIMDNIRRRGCTCLIIAHRLSTIRDCDEILVMEARRIVERGTHEKTDGAGRHLSTVVET